MGSFSTQTAAAELARAQLDSYPLTSRCRQDVEHMVATKQSPWGGQVPYNLLF